MKTFGDLRIIGLTSEQEKLIDRIEQVLNNNWVRSKSWEDRFQSEYNMACRIFIRSENPSRQEVVLIFHFHKDGYLYVSNIAPKKVELDKDEYNAILEEFLTCFIEPSAQGLNLRIVTALRELTIDNSMAPELAKLLKQFSGAANKSSAGSHPADERRLFNFIIQAHLEDALLSEDTLEGLLVEDGWSKEHASRLSFKYQFGRDLLKQFREIEA